MKTVFITDIHGEDLTPVRDYVLDSKSHTIGFLGDFEKPETLVQALDIIELQKEQGRNGMICLGNHDFDEFNKGNFSGEPRAEKYVANERELMKELNFQGLGRTIMMHAFFDGKGELDFDYLSKTLIWPTLVMESRYPAAFKLLEQNNLDIVFRGHDHIPLKVSKDRDEIIYSPLEREDEFLIDKNQKHIITVPAYDIHCLGLEIRKEDSNYIAKVRTFLD